MGLLEDHLREPVVLNRLLEVRSLRLPILRGAFHLLLHVSDGLFRGLDLLGQVLDRLLKIGDLGLQLRLLRIGFFGGPVVLVHLVDAPVTMRNLVLLLLPQFHDHLVDLRNHLLEGILLCAHRQKRNLRRACAGGDLAQGRRRSATTINESGAGHGRGLHEGDVHSLVEVGEGGVVIDDLDRVLDGGDLLQAVVDALLELLCALRALLLQPLQERSVEPQLCKHILKLLERLSVFLLEGRDLLVEFGLQLPPRSDLLLLCSLKRSVILDAFCLSFLQAAQVLLKVLLHLLKNAKDLAALWGVALEARDCQEGRPALALRLNEELAQHSSVGHCTRAQTRAAELDDACSLQLPGSFLQEAGLWVVLLKHRDRLIASLDRLDQIHLVRMKLLVLLHAEGAGLLQRLLVPVHLFEHRVALRLQLLHLGHRLAQGCLQLLLLLLRGLDGCGLLAVVRLAPAVELLVHCLVVLEAGGKLPLHVLQQSHDLNHRALLRARLGIRRRCRERRERRCQRKLHHAGEGEGWRRLQ
mmetsp:Transcript_103240/g.298658  ORF Transcript_103240/g.298658 Transcript_103240/m.298658 type:complete len:526 (-) Transcript_103240:36-1613(-)